jgi:ribonuclease-3
MNHLEALQNAIGYRFRDLRLLKTALTHSSYVNEAKEKDPLTESNERLEFLGDAVLQQAISVKLYDTFPDSAEGYLTQFRQHLVCEATLARVAGSIGLGEHLYLGRGEQAGRERPSLLSDALEALFAAVYLDSRAEDDTEASKLIARLMDHEFESCRKLRGGDYKTRLLQLVQGDGEDSLSYMVVREDGPAHDRIFEVEARLNSNVVGRGTGKSIKEAEQNAAKEALALFGIIE